MARQRLELGEEIGRHLGDVQPQPVLQLRGGDQHRDAVGEADDDADGHVAHQPSQPEQAQDEQQHAGAGRGDQQVRHAVAVDDAVDDDDEGAGGPADLHVRAAQQGDQQAGDDGGPQAGGGREAGSDGEGHRERQRHDADGQAGAEVAQEAFPAIALQGSEQAGPERGKRHRQSHRAPILAPGGSPGEGVWGAGNVPVRARRPPAAGARRAARAAERGSPAPRRAARW